MQTTPSTRYLNKRDEIEPCDGGERARKCQEAFDIESLVPNEILAMILAFVPQADVPAVGRVARRWRDLAPPAEPDIVLAHRDCFSSIRLVTKPRAEVKERYLDRLRLEANGASVADDQDADDIRDVCNAFFGQEIALWQLFKNAETRKRSVEMFAVEVLQSQDVVCGCSVAHVPTERKMADVLADWMRSELPYRADDDDVDAYDDAMILNTLDLDSDVSLRRLSNLIGRARCID